MSFPTDPVDGQEYTNPDNKNVYRWDDPPGSWALIGIDDGGGGSGGETPNPPGEGIVVGTEPRVQLYSYDNNQLVTYAKDGFAVKVDISLASGTNPFGLIFSYSYDLTTWYPCNETGGGKNGLFYGIAHGYKSNGDEVYFTKEHSQNSRIWKSSNGIDWSVQSASMPSGASGHSLPSYSRDTMVLLDPRNNSSGTIYRSTDDGATWEAKSLGFSPDRRNWYIDGDIMVDLRPGDNACRVSIDGGNTFQTCSGLGPSFNTGSGHSLTFMTKTDPKTLVVFDENNTKTTDPRCYYLKLSDIESGNTVFTRGSTDAMPTSHDGIAIAAEIDGKTSVAFFAVGTSFTRVRVVELNANNTDIENQRTYTIPSTFSSNLKYVVPQFPNLPQEGALRVLSNNNVSLSERSSAAVVGLGADLFFNGAKLALSGRNRLAF